MLASTTKVACIAFAIVAVVVLPGAAAFQTAACTDLGGSLEQLCRETLDLRCLGVEVTALGRTVSYADDGSFGGCGQPRYRFAVQVGDGKASGRLRSAGVADPGEDPPGPAVPLDAPRSQPAVPSSLPADDGGPSVGFDVYFEIHYDPCDDPAFRVDGEAWVAAPALGASRDVAERPTVSASPACAAARRLADPDGAGDDLAAALALADALLADLAPASDAPAESAAPVSEPPADPVTDVAPPQEGADGGCGCASGDARGEAAATGDAEVEAHADAGVPAASALHASVDLSALRLDPPAPAVPVETSALSTPPVATQASRPSAVDAPAARTALPPIVRERGADAPAGGAPAPAGRVTAAPRVDPGPRPSRAAIEAISLGIPLGAALARVLDAIAGYSRITPDQALDHPMRRRVFEALRARRAATPRELARDLGLGTKAVRHHLETLRRNGLAGCVRSPRGSVFHLVQARAEALHAVPVPLQRRLLDLVAASPGLNMAEVARALGVSKRAAQNHAIDLLAAGRLLQRTERRARRLYPLPLDAADAVIRQTTPAGTR